MIKNILFPVLFILFSNSLFSQNFEDHAKYGKATISENFCVSIDDTKELNTFYVLDIAPISFVDMESASKKFNSLSNNLLTYKVDFPNQLVYLQIHVNRTKELQSAGWWKNYILTLCLPKK